MRLRAVDDTCMLWRYLKPDKFQKLLENRALYCPTSKSFDDPWDSPLPRYENEAQMLAMVDKLRKMGLLDGKSDDDLKTAIDLYNRADLSFDRNR